MSRATHIIVIPAGASDVKTVSSGVEVPVVRGVNYYDWDVVEEDLPVEWVEETRRLLRLKTGYDGLHSGKYAPIGVNERDFKGSSYIKEVKPMTPILPTVDQVVAKYVETREELDRRQKELDAELAPLKEFQKKREQWLMSELNKIGANNVKTPHGTVYQTTTESVTMAEWDTFFEYVLTTKQFNLLTHAVNKTAALEIMGEERANPLPPGVNYVAIRTVNVRKS